MIPRVINNHICFTTSNAQALRNYFPDVRQAEVNGQNIYAVPLSLDSARLLRNIGIEAPSPIRTDYDFPIIPGRTPGWWQIDTAEFFTLNPRAFCLSLPRTRKTMSTLWAVDYMQKKGLMGRCLVVAPLSTLEIVWGESVWYNFPRKKYAVLHGSAEKRKALLKQEHDIYIINHDGIEIVQEELKSRTDITHIVIDELRVFFSTKTKRWKAMKSIITPERTAWGLTGTPTPNAPTDAYGQMKLIKPENFNGHFTHFKNTTMQQFGPFKWVPRRGHEEVIKKCLSPAIRFTRDVVTDMTPQLIERHAELSPQQSKHLNELMRQAATEINGTVVTAVNAAVLIQKIVQTSMGVVYGAGGEIVSLDFGPRLKVIEELVEENSDSKTIIFFPFTGVLDAFAKELKKKWSVEVVDGGVSAGKRTQIFRDFQEKKDPHILVAHPGCMAHGLELTAAALIIWAGPHNNCDTYGQACARIDGGGQKLRIDIAHVSATAAERKIYAALREKRKMQDVICELFSKEKK
jgi:SNF2 family DNA or RNA helicase